MSRHIPSHEIEHLAERERIRAKIEERIEAWIALLDRLDGDPDREPSIGAPEIAGSCRAVHFAKPCGWHLIRADQSSWAKGANDDREETDEDGDDLDRGEHDPSDFEPSLGATQNVDQTQWAQGSRRDFEDDPDPEPDHRSHARNEAELKALEERARA